MEGQSRTHKGGGEGKGRQWLGEQGGQPHARASARNGELSA
jgi:hypothetical protein